MLRITASGLRFAAGRVHHSTLPWQSLAFLVLLASMTLKSRQVLPARYFKRRLLLTALNALYMLWKNSEYSALLTLLTYLSLSFSEISVSLKYFQKN